MGRPRPPMDFGFPWVSHRSRAGHPWNNPESITEVLIEKTIHVHRRGGHPTSAVSTHFQGKKCPSGTSGVDGVQAPENLGGYLVSAAIAAAALQRRGDRTVTGPWRTVLLHRAHKYMLLPACLHPQHKKI